ncbi:pentatricopeptide repeat-containing protein At3g29290 isoform X2 [Abrus precatorius]|uniref:Pentatricopeptide repeat-containing protein At3g29290 isoform X2 n=1 Tax=Abrus precatorius TaxID=3816 RepID=A0A8B8LB72_ABRPR|nr:pentatricopeptide repeat-containing protein At3g29290 isoform X2 [Abrus precatorius]
MAIVLSFPFQFHTCLHKLCYCSFLSVPFHTNAYTGTHSNLFSIVLSSPPKHCVLSIGSTRFHESTPLSKDTVPAVVDFGVWEQEKHVDDEGRGEFDTSFVSKKELPPWGEVEMEDFNDGGGGGGDCDDDDDDEGREEFVTSFVSKKELRPWREVEMDDDDDDDDERIEDVNACIVTKKEFLPSGVEDDDDDVEGREEFDTSFLSQKELPPWGAAEDDDDDGGRANIDAYFVAKKELLPRDSRPVQSTLSASGETGLMNEHGALFLEELDENVLSNRILVLSRTNKIRSAMEYFRSMELSGLCPNIHACNSLISSLLRNGWFDDCFKVFNFTRARRITTGHTYSLVLMAHTKVHGCNSALRFFRELESECDARKDFDAIVYNTVISICRNVDNWSEIERLCRSMKANGCAGTHVTYCLLITSFVRCNQSELALYAYHEMVQNGFEPDSNTLNAIISVCAKEGKWDAALSVFQKMLKDELKPNLVACNALINSLGRAEELKLASQVYNTMKRLDLKPDAYTFNALLSSLNKAGRPHKALQLSEMIERNETSQFNIHLYNTVLMSCSKLRLWDRAIEILWQMEASGHSDLTMSYNLVIRTCELARKPTIALQVYKHMVHQKCSPNIFTYLSVIRCCVCGDLWEELEEILYPMPNATLYNAAVQGLCLRGKVNLANKVYTKMLESGLQPDVKTQILMLRMLRK